MQAVKGRLSNGWFTPNDGVALPNQIEAMLVFWETTAEPQSTETLEITASDVEKQARIDWLNRIEAALELTDDEDLSDFPKQGLMKVSYEDW